MLLLYVRINLCMVAANYHDILPIHSLLSIPTALHFTVEEEEMKKRWKVYAPLHGQETLPRISSDDFVMMGTTITSDRKDKDQNHDDDDDDDNNYREDYYLVIC